MGFKFRKSIKLAPGVKLNLNKKSTGITLGGKGFHYTVNSKGKRTKSVGIPGTGLYYSTSSSGSKKSNNKSSAKSTVNRENVVIKENENMSNKKWYHKNWGIVLLLILFFPVGLYLMWKHANWKKGIKIAVTVFILICCFFSSSDETQPTTDASVDVTTTAVTTEATTEEATEEITTETTTETTIVTTTEATTKETTTETTTKETTTEKITTTEHYYEKEEEAEMVWIPKSGSKYHSYSGCSNMKNPSEVTIDKAISRGYSPCSKCW